MTPLQNSNILKVEPAELVMFEGSEFLGIAESKEKFHVIFFYCRKFCKIRNNLENLHVFYFYLEENLQLSPIVWRKHHKGSVSLFKTIFISLVFIHRDNYTSFFYISLPHCLESSIFFYGASVMISYVVLKPLKRKAGERHFRSGITGQQDLSFDPLIRWLRKNTKNYKYRFISIVLNNCYGFWRRFFCHIIKWLVI